MFDIEKAKKEGKCLLREKEVEFIAGPDIVGMCVLKMNGVFTYSIASNLTNIPTKKQGWINIYPSSFGRVASCMIYTSKEEADNYADPDRVACIQIEWEE